MVKKAVSILLYHLRRIGKKPFVLYKRTRQRFRLEKPLVINLNANDICNSKCVMCNIWEQKQGFEISVENLENILSDKLFTEVQHVGITGGEPTLREDLVGLYRACINQLPKLQGLSIITNAIKEEDVKQKLKAINDLCFENEIPFSVMVSIDGYGENHDKIRRRKGNFETAVKVIDYARHKLKIPVSIGATISKENAWDADELLDYLKENNLYGRFRIAEYINRLYNSNRTDVIRNFDADETYNLVLFFKKLELSFEKEEVYKNTYRNIQTMLLGGKRTVGCPYQKNGIVLNSRGELQYCAPKSNLIGNALEKSAWKIYKRNVSERKRIIKNECPNCIHDYHSHLLTTEVKKRREQLHFERLFKINMGQGALIKLDNECMQKPLDSKNNGTKIFIVGWYGTETVGDKAILGGIIEHYKEKLGNAVEFAVASIYPFVTERTVFELDVKVEVVPVYSLEFIRYSKYSDITVMGGGPLMELFHLFIPEIAFRISELNKKKRVVFGCGIGPLYENYYKGAVRKILELASEVKLRDKNSLLMAKELCPQIEATNTGDMAKPYVQKVSDRISVEKEEVISCYLREWTYEYFKNIPENEFSVVKSKFEYELANLIKSIAREKNIRKIRFNHMHNFVVGNDDRDFSRYFIKKYFKDDTAFEVSYDKKLSSVESIIRSMKASKFNVCMRFHSVLFADTLDTDYVAIDYTNGGKIKGYLTDNKKLDRIVHLDDLVFR